MANQPPYQVRVWEGPTPEQEAADQQRAERLLAGVRSVTESGDIQSLPEKLSLPLGNFSAGRELHSALAALWESLISRGLLGVPTFDLVDVRVAEWPDRANGLLGGHYFTERWTEGQRQAVWHAPLGGRYRHGDSELRMDVWITDSGKIWMPANASMSDGGGFKYGVVSRDRRGVLLTPDIVMAVPSGDNLEVAVTGFWHRRSLRIRNATTVVTHHEGHAPFSPRADFGEVIRAACDRAIAA